MLCGMRFQLFILLLFLFFVTGGTFTLAADYRYCVDSEGGTNTAKADVAGYLNISVSPAPYPIDIEKFEDYCQKGNEKVRECTGEQCFVQDYYCVPLSDGKLSYNIYWTDCSKLGFAGCSEGSCTSNIAPQPESCTDMEKNQNEVDVDCGGSCPKCEIGRKCASNSDCESGWCRDGVCSAAAPTCSDGIKNRDEEKTDCGGAYCRACWVAPTEETDKGSCDSFCERSYKNDLDYKRECLQQCTDRFPESQKRIVVAEAGTPEPKAEAVPVSASTATAETDNKRTEADESSVRATVQEQRAAECPACLVCVQARACDQGEYKCNVALQTVSVCINNKWQPDDDYQGYCTERTARPPMEEGEGTNERQQGIINQVFSFFGRVLRGEGQQGIIVETGEPNYGSAEAVEVTTCATSDGNNRFVKGTTAGIWAANSRYTFQYQNQTIQPGQRAEFTDYCDSEVINGLYTEWINEFTCEQHDGDEAPYVYSYSSRCPYGCANGACLESSCVSSDGDNRYARGTTIGVLNPNATYPLVYQNREIRPGQSAEFTDYCDSEVINEVHTEWINEFYCEQLTGELNAYVNAYSIRCPYGCANGACAQG